MMKLIDFHLHIAEPAPECDTVRGCVISRSAAQNPLCAQLPQANRMASALYLGENSPAAAREVARHIGPGVTAYPHIEIMGCEGLERLAEYTGPKAFDKLPLIVHLSRHDTENLSSAEAVRCLETTRRLWPNGKIIISHLGGENFSCVLEWTQFRSNETFLDASCLEETACRARFRSADEVLAKLTATVPPEQILYGSDRVVGWRNDFTPDLNKWRAFFGDHGAERILRGNAEELLAFQQ